jgi:hypothetical protein
MKRTTRLKKLARRLLAITCLTAGSTALATTISEPPNFGTTFATATPLPAGTTIVEGSVQFPSDTNDFFTFQDLVPGTGFDFTASTTSTILEVDLLTSADTALPGSANPYVFTSSDPNMVTGLTAPSDGQIVFDVITGGGEGPARAYTIDVDTVTYGPEPGTLGVMGLGLAAGAAFALRRTKKI